MSTSSSTKNLIQSDALFIYYKVNTALHEQTAEKLKKMALEFHQTHPEISLEIMQRPEISPENMETWMEIYRGNTVNTESIMNVIATLAQKHDLPTPRRVEKFIPIIF
jgi:hypothetical protein